MVKRTITVQKQWLCQRQILLTIISSFMYIPLNEIGYKESETILKWAKSIKYIKSLKAWT